MQIPLGLGEGGGGLFNAHQHRLEEALAALQTARLLIIPITRLEFGRVNHAPLLIVVISLLIKLSRLNSWFLA